jgi:hypothetical protein
MPTHKEIEEAVSQAKRLLREHGYHCRVDAADLVRWFEADSDHDQDIDLDKVIAMPLIVVHELVEIDNVKRTGLELGKRVILDNPEAVEVAHIRATEAELEIALSTGNLEHVRTRLGHLRAWINDSSVPPGDREKYSELHARISHELDRRAKEVNE